MSNLDKYSEQILLFFNDFFNCSIPNIDDPIENYIELDSLQTTETIIYLELQFNIRIPNELITKGNFQTARTLGSLVEAITRNAVLGKDDAS